MTNKTARYRIFPQQDGNVYRFYCDVSGALVYTTGPLHAATPEEELMLAWESGARSEFNHCEKCGNWISDVMYNADVHHCVACTPWEGPPSFCPQCGKRIKKQAAQCPRCNTRLQYERVDPW